MPELPEVETIVRTLRPQIVGQRIAHVNLNRADILTPAGADLCGALEGQSIESIDRRGKRIVMRLTTGNSLLIHLGMSGRLTLASPADALLPHTHLVIGFQSLAAQLRFRDPRRFGGLWLLDPSQPADNRLGPEPMSIRSAELLRRLGKTRRCIKAALLDQALVAGLGNIYVDEALHECGVHPATLACELDKAQVSHLARAIKRVLKRALQHRGSTLRDYVDADGNAGNFQNLHRVYGREGERCRTCKSQIQRIVLAGRSTHFCPNCQQRQGK